MFFFFAPLSVSISFPTPELFQHGLTLCSPKDSGIFECLEDNHQVDLLTREFQGLLGKGLAKERGLGLLARDNRPTAEMLKPWEKARNKSLGSLKRMEALRQ